jgi:hypothetical protein
LLVLDVAVQGLLASSKNLTIGPSIAGCVWHTNMIFLKARLI